MTDHGVEYEYGIQHLYRYLDLEPHRSGMTEQEAQKWLAEWIEMGGRPDTFVVIRRPVGVWKHVVLEESS